MFVTVFDNVRIPVDEISEWDLVYKKDSLFGTSLFEVWLASPGGAEQHHLGTVANVEEQVWYESRWQLYVAGARASAREDVLSRVIIPFNEVMRKFGS